jgi:peptidoglycan/xylan/chitin deacetylase (PgdA/CDA1 family)
MSAWRRSCYARTVIVAVGVVLGVIFLAHTAPFPFLLDWPSTHSVWHMPQARGQRTLYLTFDDGPNPATTPELLDLLAREHVHATFFLIDRYVTEDTAPLVQRMFEDGHAVALHSDTRKLMVLSPGRLAETLTAAADKIERLSGSRPCPAFRPHGGWRSAMMYAGLKQLNYTLIGWTFLRWDWNWFRKRTADSIINRILSHATPGDIIVTHDGDHAKPNADQRYVVEAWRRLIPELKSRGFDFDTVCTP